MAVVLPLRFQVLDGAGGIVISPRHIIGSGDEDPTRVPQNEQATYIDNSTFLWSNLNLRRLAHFSAYHGSIDSRLEESTDTAAAPAVPFAPVNPNYRGILRLAPLAAASVGRDSANTALYLEVDHEDGHVNIVVEDRAASVGFHFHNQAVGRATALLSATGVFNTLGTRDVIVKIYMASVPASGISHKLYGVRVYEGNIPVSDL